MVAKSERENRTYSVRIVQQAVTNKHCENTTNQPRSVYVLGRYDDKGIMWRYNQA